MIHYVVHRSLPGLENRLCKIACFLRVKERFALFKEQIIFVDLFKRAKGANLAINTKSKKNNEELFALLFWE